jgi:hypothetical protein
MVSPMAARWPTRLPISRRRLSPERGGDDQTTRGGDRRQTRLTRLDIRPALPARPAFKQMREVGPTVRVSFAPARSPLRNLMPTISLRPVSNPASSESASAASSTSMQRRKYRNGTARV